MDVFLRNIDAGAIAKTDEAARKKGMSRNELLKNLIESYSVAPDLHELDTKYECLIREITSVLERNSEVMQEVLDLLDRPEQEGKK